MHQLRLSSTRERSGQKEKNHQKGQDAKTDTAYVSVNRVIINLRTTDLSPRSSPLIASHAGVFRGAPREEERLRLSDRNSILMT